MKNERERMISALESFYEEVLRGGKPTDLLVLRISKENKVSKSSLKVWISKINQHLVADKIKKNWNLKDKIREIVNPKEVQKERYERAKLALRPEVTCFEVEQIASRFNLTEEQRKDLRYEADEMNRRQKLQQTSKSRLEAAKEEIKKIFLADPQKLSKESFERVAARKKVEINELISYYRANKSKWVKKRKRATTIEELLKKQ